MKFNLFILLFFIAIIYRMTGFEMTPANLITFILIGIVSVEWLIYIILRVYRHILEARNG